MRARQKYLISDSPSCSRTNTRSINEGYDRTEITELGIPYGTATYAAPEQAKGERADHRCDIFSTGVLIYEMLTGIWAFQGKTVIDVRHQVLYGKPKLLAELRKEPLPPQIAADRR